jgi:GNAT superfamily N-acetyltransferase
MKVIDLTDEHKGLFAVCLEDWSADAREASDRRARSVDRFLAKGLRVKLAVDDGGTVGGMIQYLPVEQSQVDGSGLYFIQCIWVHGHEQGRGNFQKRGMGTALLEAAEADARALGAKGMAAWGLLLPFWMKASWFRKHGYRKADRQGVALLLYKPFADDARPPRWRPKGKTLPDAVPGKVNVTCFVNGFCMVGHLMAARAERAATEIGDRVVYREIDTSDPTAVATWGFVDELFVDGKAVRSGPPKSYEKIRSIIAKRARRV